VLRQKLCIYFNIIRVRSFILNGAPFALFHANLRFFPIALAGRYPVLSYQQSAFATTLRPDGWGRPTDCALRFHLFSETHLRVASQRSCPRCIKPSSV